MSIDTGGQAFPVPSDGLTHGTQPGMTLLDHLASTVLPVIMVEYKSAGAKVIANMAYTQATAMIAEKRRIEGGAQ